MAAGDPAIRSDRLLAASLLAGAGAFAVDEAVSAAVSTPFGLHPAPTWRRPFPVDVAAVAGVAVVAVDAAGDGDRSAGRYRQLQVGPVTE
jgi:hypothetical protein